MAAGAWRARNPPPDVSDRARKDVRKRAHARLAQRLLFLSALPLDSGRAQRAPERAPAFAQPAPPGRENHDDGGRDNPLRQSVLRGSGQSLSGSGIGRIVDVIEGAPETEYGEVHALSGEDVVGVNGRRETFAGGEEAAV